VDPFHPFHFFPFSPFPFSLFLSPFYSPIFLSHPRLTPDKLHLHPTALPQLSPNSRSRDAPSRPALTPLWSRGHHEDDCFALRVPESEARSLPRLYSPRLTSTQLAESVQVVPTWHIHRAPRSWHLALGDWPSAHWTLHAGYQSLVIRHSTPDAHTSSCSDASPRAGSGESPSWTPAGSGQRVGGSQSSPSSPQRRRGEAGKWEAAKLRGREASRLRSLER
jgi:hypothetical protein